MDGIEEVREREIFEGISEWPRGSWEDVVVPAERAKVGGGLLRSSSPDVSRSQCKQQ